MPSSFPLRPPSNLRGITVLSISLVTFAVAAHLVLLRMYVRMKRHITGADDYTICLALALSLLGTVANVYQVTNGAGRHIGALMPDQLSEFIKWTFVEGVAFAIGTCFVKISVCIFILRFINKTRRMMRHFIYVLMSFLIVSTLGLVVALLAQCRPLNALYILNIEGKCYSKNVSIIVAYVQAGGITPSPAEKKSLTDDQLSTYSRTSFVLAYPFFTAIFSVLRIGFLYTNYSADVTYDNLVNVMFAVLEMNLGIVAASVATLRPLFSNLGPMVRVASDANQGQYASGQPFFRKASKAGSKLRSIPLNPTGITKTTDIDVSRGSGEV
ncbi:MAG: hypothetical protein Q9222_001183 [Ikaeria aurantiellina]